MHARLIVISAYVYGLSYNGPYTPQSYTAHLHTPALNITVPHCLKLSMFSAERFMIYETSLSWKKDLLLDSAKGVSVGKLVTFSLTVSQSEEEFFLEFVWPEIFVKDGGYIAAVKIIDLKEGHCHQGIL